VPQIGKAIITGLLSALIPGGPEIAGKLAGIAKSGFAAFKSVFGIQSPSKEMMLAGGFVVSGFTGSIDAGAGDVASSMQSTFAMPDVGSLEMPSLSASAMPSAQSLGLPASGGVAAAAGRVGGEVGINAPVTIIIDGAKEPQAVAAAVQSRLSRSIESLFEQHAFA